MELTIKVLVTDNIMQKGQEASAGAPILKGFLSPIDATVVEKLNTAGIGIAGRVGMDEFGVLKMVGLNRASASVASVSETGGNASEVKNAKETDKEMTAAIKKASAARSVSVLCNDIFGSIRGQAPLHGLSYLQPTYGTVSRYGLIPTASSMDQIGILCTDPTDGFALLSKIAGKDEKDGAMYPEETYDYAPNNVSDPKSPKKIKVAFPENVWGKIPEKSHFEKFETKTTTLKYYEWYRQVLSILSCAEICNNTNRYDGIKFGYRAKNYAGINDLYVNSRSEALGSDAKLAIIMGAIVLSQDNYVPYYEKAMKLRRLIKESVKFDDYDVIALPVQTGKTPYEESALYALTALAGLPSLTVPLAEGGIQLIANTRREDILHGAWEVLKS